MRKNILFLFAFAITISGLPAYHAFSAYCSMNQNGGYYCTHDDGTFEYIPSEKAGDSSVLKDATIDTDTFSKKENNIKNYNEKSYTTSKKIEKDNSSRSTFITVIEAILIVGALIFLISGFEIAPVIFWFGVLGIPGLFIGITALFGVNWDKPDSMYNPGTVFFIWVWICILFGPKIYDEYIGKRNKKKQKNN